MGYTVPEMVPACQLAGAERMWRSAVGGSRVWGNARLGCVGGGVPGVRGGENQEKPEAASWLGMQRGRTCPSPDPQSGRWLHALRHVGLGLTLTSTSTSERNQTPHPCWELKQAEARHQIRDIKRLPGTPPRRPSGLEEASQGVEGGRQRSSTGPPVGGWHGHLEVAGEQSQLNPKEMGRRTRRAWASMTGHDAWARGAGAGDFTLK